MTTRRRIKLCDVMEITTTAAPPQVDPVISLKDHLTTSVQRYFSDQNNLKKMIEYINNYPLRVLEWGVVNYSKESGAAYYIERANGSLREFRINSEYETRLSSLNKALFDIYCRGPRTTINYATGNPTSPTATLDTTLAQLSFFMWAIENKVLDYVVLNYETIRKHLESRERKPSATPRTKTELCKSYIDTIHMESTSDKLIIPL